MNQPVPMRCKVIACLLAPDKLPKAHWVSLTFCPVQRERHAVSWLESVTCRALLAACAASLAVAAEVRGQLIGLSDDIVLLSRGASQAENARKRNALGRMPGSGSSPFSNDPGGRDNRRKRVPIPAAAAFATAAAVPGASGTLSTPQAAERPHSEAAAPSGKNRMLARRACWATMRPGIAARRIRRPSERHDAGPGH